VVALLIVILLTVVVVAVNSNTVNSSGGSAVNSNTVNGSGGSAVNNNTVNSSGGSSNGSPPDGATARDGPWPPLQCASKPLDSLLCLSIHLNPSSSGPWTRHPATSFLAFLFVLLHTAFRTSFFGIAVSCILSM